MHGIMKNAFERVKRFSLLFLGFFLALTVTASGAFAAEAKVRVLATTYPVYLLTRVVTRTSPDVQVDLLIPAQTGCPHDYALSPKDMQKLATAQIVVMNGMGLEAFLSKPLAAAPDIKIIDSSVGVNVIAEEGDEPDHDQGAEKGDGHDHSGQNPHAFSSPAQAALMVRNIGRGLAEVAPESAQNAIAAADAYALKLEALGKRFAAIGAKAANKNVVALHDGMAYLVRDAGLELTDIIQEDEESQPSAARLLELSRKLKADRPALIIGEPQYSDKPVLALSSETGVPSVQLDPVASGPANAPLDYYESVMTKNCQLLEKSLVK